MMRLGVNIDHIATLRQARLTSYPDPIYGAVLAALAGADNITCHLREDRRHIQDRDVRLLRSLIDKPLNFEMALTPEMVDFAIELKPAAVTLVPERREELTTEGGLNINALSSKIQSQLPRLKKAGILVSLFIEAEQKAIDLASELGVDAVELHTGTLCEKLDSLNQIDAKIELMKEFNLQAEYAKSLKLAVLLGHGINYKNAAWMQWISCAEEANIGHAIVSQALFIGLDAAVKSMKQLLNDPTLRPWLT